MGDPAAVDSAPDISASMPQPDPSALSGMVQNGPTPILAQQQQQPPSRLNSILAAVAGVVSSGLAGGGRPAHGRASFASGLAGGAEAQLGLQQRQFENQQQQSASDRANQELASRIKFQTAQAAQMVAETSMKQKQLDSYDEDHQLAITKDNLSIMDDLQKMGISPIATTTTNAGSTQNTKSAMDNLARTSPVPPTLTLHLGHQAVSYDLNQLAPTPEAMDQVNRVRKLQGIPAYSQQTWSQIARTPGGLQQAHDAFEFFAPMPSEDNLIKYKNIQANLKNQPDYTGKAEDVAKVGGIVTNMQKMLDEQAQRGAKQKAAETKTVGAATAQVKGQEAYAEEKGKNKADMEMVASGGADDFGNPVAPQPGVDKKEYNKRVDSFKKNADNLTQTEQTFRQFQSVLNDINAGKDITGAQSVVGLFNAIGISAEPLKGKGFRINNNTVEEHKDALGLSDKAVRSFERLKNGEVVSPQQLKDYASIAMNARKDAYVTNYNQAKSSGINPSFLLPKGNGQKIDPYTASIFMELAGKDPNKAMAAAQKSGWTY